MTYIHIKQLIKKHYRFVFFITNLPYFPTLKRDIYRELISGKSQTVPNLFRSSAQLISCSHILFTHHYFDPTPFFKLSYISLFLDFNQAHFISFFCFVLYHKMGCIRLSAPWRIQPIRCIRNKCYLQRARSPPGRITVHCHKMSTSSPKYQMMQHELIKIWPVYYLCALSSPIPMHL